MGGYTLTDTLTRKGSPALFISKDGASRAGLRVIAKLPTRIGQFKIVGPTQRGGDRGYELLLLPTDLTMKPTKLTNEALELLL